MGLLVPGRSSRGVRDPCLLLVGKQRDYKTTAPKAPKQSARSPSPTNALAPRSPGADESLLESALHLPERLTNQEIIRSGCAPRPGHSKDQRRRGSTPDGSGKPPFVLQTHARRAEVPPSWTGRKSSSRAAAGHAARRLLRTVARRGPKPVSS